MTFQSAPFWWLTCDAPECNQRCPTGDYEVTAWGEKDDAEESASDSDWKVTDDHRHYCADHDVSVCRACDTYDPTPLAGERDYLCTRCYELETGAAP